jgi:CRISPR/Cas system-associated exonuclease Cas4 (RecB family)
VEAPVDADQTQVSPPPVKVDPTEDVTAPMTRLGEGEDDLSAEAGLLPQAAPPKEAPAVPAPPKAPRVWFPLVAILLLLPFAAGYGLWSMKDQSPWTDTEDKEKGGWKEKGLLRRLGDLLGAGGSALGNLLSPPPPPVAAGAPESPRRAKTSAEREREKIELRDLIVDEYKSALNKTMKYLKMDADDGTAELNAAKESADRTWESYRTMTEKFKTDYNEEPPVKAKLQLALRDHLTELYLEIRKVEHNARKAVGEIAAPMMRKVNRMKRSFNERKKLFQSESGVPFILEGETTPVPDFALTGGGNPKAEAKARLDALYKEFGEAERTVKAQGPAASSFDQARLERLQKLYEETKAAYEKEFKEAYTPPK